jgi:hypothetical protein
MGHLLLLRRHPSVVVIARTTPAAAAERSQEAAYGRAPAGDLRTVPIRSPSGQKQTIRSDHSSPARSEPGFLRRIIRKDAASGRKKGHLESQVPGSVPRWPRKLAERSGCPVSGRPDDGMERDFSDPDRFRWKNSMIVSTSERQFMRFLSVLTV